jgi:hypothetical protein
LAEDPPALRPISIEAISVSGRREFRHATASIFGSLKVRFFSALALNGSFQLTNSTRFANVSRIGARKWFALLAKSGLDLFSHTDLMKRLTKCVMGVTHASIPGV